LECFLDRGISNPLEVIEQITYLLFLKRLDDLHTLEENKAALPDCMPCRGYGRACSSASVRPHLVPQE
jgi:hypothetical protein